MAQVPLHVEVWPSRSVTNCKPAASNILDPSKLKRLNRASTELPGQGLGHGRWHRRAREHAALHVQQLLIDGILERLARLLQSLAGKVPVPRQALRDFALLVVKIRKRQNEGANARRLTLMSTQVRSTGWSATKDHSISRHLPVCRSLA